MWLSAAALGQGYSYSAIVDTDGVFDGANPPSVNAAGQVAFFAFRDDGSAGIFVSNGVTTTTIVDDSGDYSFRHPGITLASFPAMGNNGQVAFFAYRDYGEEGIYCSAGGPITTIAESGTGNYACAESNPSVNDQGHVAFRACLWDIGGALLIGDGLSATDLIDESGAASSVTDMVALNNSDTIAFRGVLSDGRQGVFRTAGGAVTTIADNTTTFAWFEGNVDINNDGVVIFCGVYSDGLTRGVFTGDGTMPTTIGDTSGSFSGFDTFSAGINGAGQIAFLAQLGSGVEGIFTGPTRSVMW